MAPESHPHATTRDLLSPNAYSPLLLKSVSFLVLHVSKYSNYAHMFQIYIRFVHHMRFYLILYLQQLSKNY